MWEVCGKWKANELKFYHIIVKKRNSVDIDTLPSRRISKYDTNIASVLYQLVFFAHIVNSFVLGIEGVYRLLQTRLECLSPYTEGILFCLGSLTGALNPYFVSPVLLPSTSHIY